MGLIDVIPASLREQRSSAHLHIAAAVFATIIDCDVNVATA
jgi:hypothetical protein